jgi:hypothetical protein
MRQPVGGFNMTAPKTAVRDPKFYSRSHPMIVRVFDESGALIQTHE